MNEMNELNKSITILWAMYVQAKDKGFPIAEEIRIHLQHLLEIQGYAANRLLKGHNHV